VILAVLKGEVVSASVDRGEMDLLSKVLEAYTLRWALIGVDVAAMGVMKACLSREWILVKRNSFVRPPPSPCTHANARLAS